MQFGLASLLKIHHSEEYFVDVLEFSKSKEKREIIKTDQKVDRYLLVIKRNNYVSIDLITEYYIF